MATPSLPDLHDNNARRVALKEIIEKALKGYISLVQDRYPALRYCKVGAIKSLPGARSQYEGHGGKFHSDYPRSSERRRVGAQVPPRVNHRWIEFIQFHVAT